MSQPRATVAITRTLERHRSEERVRGLVGEAVGLLGGMDRFVRPGQTVFIKPNQTVFYSAEEGCTTDPLVVMALVRLAKEAGAKKIQVGDSSGGTFSSMQVMEITGVKAAAERAGAEVVDLKQCPTRRVEIPHGKVLAWTNLPVPLVDADVIISAPKCKTHHIDPISGALKNWVGTLNQQERHRIHGGPQMLDAFMDIMTVVPPALVVMDALICGEGDGPIGNHPRWNGCILASTDPVALDVTATRMMGLDWKRLRFAETAEAHGLGVQDPERIDIMGERLEAISFQAWQGHQGFDYLPVNLIVGKGVTIEGTIGHVKSLLDSWLARGELQKILWLKGTPTIMIGEADDPHFEEHLQQGPYIVFDDAARPEYKNDLRVHFVPGHPVLEKAMPQLMKQLGIQVPAKAMMKWQQFQRWGVHNLEHGTPARKVQTVARPLAAAGLAAAATYIGARLLSRTAWEDGGDGA